MLRPDVLENFDPLFLFSNILYGKCINFYLSLKRPSDNFPKGRCSDGALYLIEKSFYARKRKKGK